MTDNDLGKKILETFEDLKRAKAEWAAHKATSEKMNAELYEICRSMSNFRTSSSEWTPNDGQTWQSSSEFNTVFDELRKAEQRIDELKKLLRDMGTDPA